MITQRLSIVLSLLLAGCGKPKPFIIEVASPELADVQAAIDNANEGDTVNIPAGTATWTQKLKIEKAVILQGHTTITGAGSVNCTANDQTIIKDDVSPRDKIIDANLTNADLSSTFRITGITFVPGTLTSKGGVGALTINRTAAPYAYNVRIDHCHFALLYQNKLIHPVNYVYGLFDNNLVEARDSAFPFNPENGGPTGNPAWADYPHYGTRDFWFIESNSFTRTGTTFNALTDGYYGGRYVVRHNFIENCSVQSHGTEGGAPRGQRAAEVYDNIFHTTIAWVGHGIRSGGLLFHDNIFYGTPAGHPPDVISLTNYRENPSRPFNTWGNADGTSVWDKNSTEPDGTWVEGKLPYTFAKGTATGATTVAGQDATFTANPATPWATDQWHGPAGIYSVKNVTLNSPYYAMGSQIQSNTPNSITYYYYAATDTGGPWFPFAVGEDYEIHRVLQALDQCGAGKADLLVNVSSSITGTNTFGADKLGVSSVAGFPVTGGEFIISSNIDGAFYRVKYTGLTSTTSPKTFNGCTWEKLNNGPDTLPAGKTVLAEFIAPSVPTYGNKQTWPHQAVEPAYAWNNVYVGTEPMPTPAPGATPAGTIYKMYVGKQPTTLEGTDFFNLDARPWDRGPQEVQAKYVAALNGEAYTGTYAYPHPLVSGGGGSSPSPAVSPSLPSATPSATATSTSAPTVTPTATVEPSPTPTATANATGTPLILILRPGDTITITVPASP